MCWIPGAWAAQVSSPVHMPSGAHGSRRFTSPPNTVVPAPSYRARIPRSSAHSASLALIASADSRVPRCAVQTLIARAVVTQSQRRSSGPV
jgi:hypothetical protein